MLDTNSNNGGMEVVKNTHKKGVIGPHIQSTGFVDTHLWTQIGSVMSSVFLITPGDHHCCAGGTWYIEMDEDVIESTFDCSVSRDSFRCEVPLGGALLFSNALVHRYWYTIMALWWICICFLIIRSLPNLSDKIRWSIDLRWQVSKRSRLLQGIRERERCISRDRGQIRCL